MTVRRETGEITHHRFSDLPAFLRSGDLLVVNDTKVIRGRLRARKGTGGCAEVFLLGRTGGGEGPSETWEALARPGRRLREKMELCAGEGVRVTLLEKREGGRWIVRIDADGPVPLALERVGEVPLPPYIRRLPGDPEAQRDARRFQTVFAVNPGSVAAPTAGLHFDEEMLDQVRRAGADIAAVTLSIGYGTFSPIRTEDVEAYEIHPEPYRLPPGTAGAVDAARKRGGRIIAVGTTSARTLEVCARRDGRVESGDGIARNFIYPGYRFRVVDAMLTNFHLPRSTLLALVMAFAGVEQIRDAYRCAIEHRYRFYSYGDAMLLL